MKLAVMQPYLFPYIGYFQLISAVDLFLVYDDVNYIKQGYINRNAILTNNEVCRFTVPVPGASSNKKICELNYSEDVRKVTVAIRQAYGKAPFFKHVYPLVEEILNYPNRNIGELCFYSFNVLFAYLGVSVDVRLTSKLDYDRAVSAERRLVNLCREFEANTYVNAAGGKSLYSKEYFKEHNIELCFLESGNLEYIQGGKKFVSHLSIIDCLMQSSPAEIRSILTNYRLT